MAKRDLVRDLERLNPIPAVLAIKSNAESGYYSKVPSANLVRDLQELTLEGDDDRSDCDAFVVYAQRGAYTENQNVRYADAQRAAREPAAEESPPSEPDSSVATSREPDGGEPAADAKAKAPATPPAPPVGGGSPSSLNFPPKPHPHVK